MIDRLKLFKSNLKKNSNDKIIIMCIWFTFAYIHAVHLTFDGKHLIFHSLYECIIEIKPHESSKKKCQKRLLLFDCYMIFIKCVKGLRKNSICKSSKVQQLFIYC